MTLDPTGRRFLVTGGAGFIGSHLADALLEGGAERVIVVDNFFLGRDRNLESATGYDDRLIVIRDDAARIDIMRTACEAHEPDIVFNLATKALLYSFSNPAEACRVNLDLALTLGELLREGAYGRLVQVSSSEVYGTAVSVPMDESHPLRAETTYAAGKAAADLALMSYRRMHDLPLTVVRPFNNYGPRQNDGEFAAVVPCTVQRILAGEPPRIEGDGEQTRDFMYVGDTVRGMLALAGEDAALGKAVHLASGTETPIGEVVRKIVELLGWEGEIVFDPARPADVQRHCADTGLAESMIGPAATTPLDEGLAATIEWYRTAGTS